MCKILSTVQTCPFPCGEGGEPERVSQNCNDAFFLLLKPPHDGFRMQTSECTMLEPQPQLTYILSGVGASLAKCVHRLTVLESQCMENNKYPCM